MIVSCIFGSEDADRFSYHVHGKCLRTMSVSGCIRTTPNLYEVSDCQCEVGNSQKSHPTELGRAWYFKTKKRPVQLHHKRGKCPPLHMALGGREAFEPDIFYIRFVPSHGVLLGEQGLKGIPRKKYKASARCTEYIRISVANPAGEGFVFFLYKEGSFPSRKGRRQPDSVRVFCAFCVRILACL